MKRSILCICAFALLCTLLCGCGSGRDRDMVQQSPSVTIELIPEPSPMVSMDPADGYVKDQDGVIDEHDSGTSYAVVTPSASPSPGAGLQQGQSK